jgi:hypothetical protein
MRLAIPKRIFIPDSDLPEVIPSLHSDGHEEE